MTNGAHQTMKRRNAALIAGTLSALAVVVLNVTAAIRAREDCITANDLAYIYKDRLETAFAKCIVDNDSRFCKKYPYLYSNLDIADIQDIDHADVACNLASSKVAVVVTVTVVFIGWIPCFFFQYAYKNSQTSLQRSSFVSETTASKDACNA